MLRVRHPTPRNSAMGPPSRIKLRSVWWPGCVGGGLRGEIAPVMHCHAFVLGEGEWPLVLFVVRGGGGKAPAMQCHT
eukprot:scaffold6694_cov101-Isochrysis_galbana.AAC.7